jgi:hypothetical protein
VATPVERDPSLPTAAPTAVEADVIAKADAGASLYWSIYFADRDEVLKLMDCKPVARAFARAQTVFGPRG